MATRADNDLLFEALLALKRGPSDPAWRVIDGWLKARLPRAKDDDARQATLLAIHRNVASLDARDASSAAAWVKRIAERKRIDAARLERGRRTISLVGMEGEDLPIEGGSTPALSDEDLPALLSEIEAAVDRVLEAEHPRALDRIVPRAQARARLLRTLGHGVSEIRDALAFGEPLSDALVSKWIERGLAPLKAGIAAWRAQAPAFRDELAEALLERIEARRADAGKPRPTRRNPGRSGGVSVARRKLRRRAVYPVQSHRARAARAPRAPRFAGRRERA